jgi:hypothetical protein
MDAINSSMFSPSVCVLVVRPRGLPFFPQNELMKQTHIHMHTAPITLVSFDLASLDLDIREDPAQR